MKTCSACRETKEETEFYRDSSTPSGLSLRCKVCDRKKNRQYWKDTYYPANREQIIQTSTENRKRRKQSGTEAP